MTQDPDAGFPEEVAEPDEGTPQPEPYGPDAIQDPEASDGTEADE